MTYCQLVAQIGDITNLFTDKPSETFSHQIDSWDEPDQPSFEVAVERLAKHDLHGFHWIVPALDSSTETLKFCQKVLCRIADEVEGGRAIAIRDEDNGEDGTVARVTVPSVMGHIAHVQMEICRREYMRDAKVERMSERLRNTPPNLPHCYWIPLTNRTEEPSFMENGFWRP